MADYNPNQFDGDDRGKLQQSHPAAAPQEQRFTGATRGIQRAFDDKCPTPGCPYMAGHMEVCKVPEKKPEAVNHPSHYGGKDNLYEVRKVIRAWGLGFNLGNAVKYIGRAGKKDPSKHIEDLEKAIFYINDEIEFLKSQVDN